MASTHSTRTDDGEPRRRVATPRPSHWARRLRSRPAQAGYVLPLTALLLIPLVAFTGMAVDLGAWQARAASAQRAADAAALAGVSYLPNEAAAVDAARQVAARNGFDHASADTTVTVQNLGNQQLSVSISQTDVNQYFTGTFANEVNIGRGAVAEYVLPVALGSPRNFLGTGNLAGVTSSQQVRGMPGLASSNAENYWLSINGPCSSREQGDWIMPISVSNFTSGNPPAGGFGWRGCNSAQNAAVQMTESHDPNGYFIGFKVPDDFTGASFTVQLFDASRCNHANSNPVAPNTAGIDFNATGAGFWTRFRMRGTNNTPFEPTNNPVLNTRTFNTGDNCAGAGTPSGVNCGNSSWAMRWCDFHTVTNPVPGGIYYLQVDTGPIPTGASNAQHFLNSYAVRVRTGAQFQACSSDPFDQAVSYNAQCIQVFAFEWLSVFANFADTQPTFFLADIGPEHSNKTMEISLYDVGEGTVGLQILDPLGNVSGFDWSVLNETGSDVPPTDGWEGTVAPGGTLDVRGLTSGNACGGGNMQPGPGRVSSSKYNDRFLTLEIDLPEDILAAYGGRTWWRVRYQTCAAPGAAPSDRTTWGVVVRGDPVRLVQ
ncbi:MAG: hypothetical protein JJU45_07715 [Acidimicrobiia bacterium]|nr:hypothetical protein [Acidimicrobiia bacterium]